MKKYKYPISLFLLSIIPYDNIVYSNNNSIRGIKPCVKSTQNFNSERLVCNSNLGIISSSNILVPEMKESIGFKRIYQNLRNEIYMIGKYKLSRVHSNENQKILVKINKSSIRSCYSLKSRLSSHQQFLLIISSIAAAIIFSSTIIQERRNQNKVNY